MNIFIDGQAGTTGLQLESRLRQRNDINILEIEQDLRKDPSARKALMDKSDVVFLCLPDDEARKSAEMASFDTIVIDASTAHRTANGWAYGFPELSSAHREKVKTAKRIANPGCHATGFIGLVYPLIKAGIISKSAQLHCTSLTGYSGGGKAMIADYETTRTPGDKLQAPRPYALGLSHKHLPEMKTLCGLDHAPHFMPVVGDMAQGMLVNVPLWATNKTQIWETLKAHYANSNFIKVMPQEYELDNGFLDPTACNNTNKMEIFVFGSDTQVMLTARLDNLGKGASGAAVQSMNIVLGLDENIGL